MDTLDKHFRELTKAAFARYGAGRAGLWAAWPEIAGADIAAVGEPDSVRWPRRDEETRKTGGTLIVRAAAGRALDIQYASPLLIERLNRYFGYGAIAAIKVVQSAKPLVAGERPRPAPATNRPLPDFPEGPLKHALERLGANLTIRGNSAQGH